MTRFNPTRIANRIGRIIFATILAGVFVGILGQFSGGIFVDGPTSPTADPLNMYFGAAIDVAVTSVLLFLAVPVVILAYWGLSSRLHPVQTWSILVGVALLGTSAWIVSESGPHLFADPLWGIQLLIATCAVLGAVAITEALTQADVDLAPRQLATGTGALALVFVLIVPAAMVGAGVVGDGYVSDDAEYDSSEYTGNRDDLENSAEPADEADDTSDQDDGWSDEDLYGGSPTDPETYDNGDMSPKIENATSLGGQTEDMRVKGVNESNLPTGNESVDYPLAAVHSSGENLTVSNIQFEIQNETVVPKARYHVSIDGADTETAYQLGIGAYWEYDSEYLHENAYTFVASGPYVGLEDGFFVDMERVKSTHIYFDMVTDDGEIHRYVVELERTGV